MMSGKTYTNYINIRIQPPGRAKQSLTGTRDLAIAAGDVELKAICEVGLEAVVETLVHARDLGREVEVQVEERVERAARDEGVPQPPRRGHHREAGHAHEQRSHRERSARADELPRSHGSAHPRDSRRRVAVSAPARVPAEMRTSRYVRGRRRSAFLRARRRLGKSPTGHSCKPRR